MLCMVSSVAPNGPSFDTVVHFQRIPAAFKEIIGKKDISAIYLREPSSDRKFRVVTKRDADGKLVMQVGLKDFMVSNGTSKSDFLVHNHLDGELRFHVHVLNPSQMKSQSKNQVWNDSIATSAEKREHISLRRIYEKEDQLLQVWVKEIYQHTKNARTKKIPDFLKAFSGSLVMLFLSFSGEKFDDYKTKFNEVAALYKMKRFSFLLCDSEASHYVFQIVQQKYLNANVEADEIAPWLEEYMEGKLRPSEESEPIPVGKNEPVKVVVRDRIRDMVLRSRKNVSNAKREEIAGLHEEHRADKKKQKVQSSKSYHPDLGITMSDRIGALAEEISRMADKRVAQSIPVPGDRPSFKAQSSSSITDHLLGHLSQAMIWAAAAVGSVGMDAELVEKTRMTREQLKSVDKKIEEVRLRARLAEEKCKLEAERDERIKSKEKELEAARDKLKRFQEAVRVAEHERNQSSS